jgi:GNAT superfamily N-acetyltransferase
MLPVPFALRRARPADGEPVRDLVFAVLRAYDIEPDPDNLDADVVRFGSAPDDVWPYELVAEVDGAVAGCVALTDKRPGVAYLSKLFVDPGRRRAGVGRALLTAAVDEARRRSIPRVELQTRTIFLEAVRLYEATGWRRGPDPTHGLGPDRTYFLDL